LGLLRSACECDLEVGGGGGGGGGVKHTRIVFL
jgi:hypothetical protein